MVEDLQGVYWVTYCPLLPVGWDNALSNKGKRGLNRKAKKKAKGRISVAKDSSHSSSYPGMEEKVSADRGSLEKGLASKAMEK